MAMPDPGYCLFLAERMLDLLPRIHDEADGVRRGGDIEHVHRMRVSTRRLRALLTLLDGCAGPRERRRWRREVRAVTRALGAARDADVQIDFLRAYGAGLPGVGAGGAGFMLPEAAPRGTEPAGARGFAALRERLRRARGVLRRHAPDDALPAVVLSPSADQGIGCLLLRLGQEREALQPGVVEALDRFEASGVLGRMSRWARTTEVGARRAGALSRSAPVYGSAYLAAAVRSDELAGLAPALQDPARATDHHAMRIAAKRFRYTLEAYAPLFDDGLKTELKALKRLQEALGELHDCDVWIARLPAFLEEERGRSLAYFGHDGFFRFVEPGVRQFLEDRVAARPELHRAALAAWEGLEQDRYLERLLGRLAAARDDAAPPPAALRAIAEGDGTARIAVLADIHGNLSALEAVVADAAARGAEVLVNAGETVGRGRAADAVVRRLVELGSVDVAGERDRKVVRAAARGAGTDGSGGPARVAAGMDPARLAYLAGLPSERRIALRGTRLLVTGRYPPRGQAPVGPATGPDELDRLARSADADVVIVGRGPGPFVLSAAETVFVNPGSVGRGEGSTGEPRAEYALLQLFPLDAVLLSVPYGAPGADRVARADPAREPTG